MAEKLEVGRWGRQKEARSQATSEWSMYSRRARVSSTVRRVKTRGSSAPGRGGRTAFAPGEFRVQPAIGVPAERPLAHGPHGHFLQPVQMLMYRLGAHVSVRAQEYLKVVIENTVKTAQCHIFYTFFLMHEGGQVLV